MRRAARAVALLCFAGSLLGAHAQTPPPQEYALEFHVDHTASAQLSLQSEFTMEVWILPKMFGNPFLGNSGTPTGQGVSYMLRLNFGGNVEFTQVSATTGTNMTAGPIPLRQWTHVAAVVGGGMARYYLNGVEVGSTQSLGPPDNSLPFVVGTQLMDFGLCCGVSAAFRQVRVWNRALSAAEVLTMSGMVLQGNEMGLVAYWPLDDGIGLQPRNVVAGGPALLLGLVPEPDTRDPRWARTVILENGPFFVQETYQIPNLGTFVLGNGVLIDFDHDGDLDVILHSRDDATLTEFPPNPLFALRNDGTGHFTEDSAAVFAGQSIDMIGVNFDSYQARDFNGDGLIDLFIAEHGPDGITPACPPPGACGGQNRMLIQTAAGQLVDETATRLPMIMSVGHNSASGDADDDGDIDLFTPAPCCGEPSNLDINDGAGHFTNQTSRLSPQLPIGCGPQSAVFFDADNDGDDDLLIGEACSDLAERDFLYINDGAGNLVRTPREAIRAHPFRATTLGVDAGDFDGDGWIDLVEIMRAADPNIIAPPGGHFDRLRLLLNNRDGTFRDATGRIPQNWEYLLDFGINNLHVVDVNQDGKLDIVLEGDAGTTRQRLFLNQGSASFIDATELLPQDAPCGECQPGLPVVESLLPGDLDGDQDIDLFANVGGRFFVVRNVKQFTDLPTPVLPAINMGGVVNAGSFAPMSAVSPGSITAVFGTNLATGVGIAGAIPLPTTLAGAQLDFNGSVLVPEFFASPSQINIQVPWELAGQAQALLVNSVNGVPGDPETVPLAQFAPGLFSTNQTGTGQGAILIANTGGIFAAPVGIFPTVSSRPAIRGMDFLEIYWTGGGSVNPPIATGAAASANPLSSTSTTPTVTIGGVNAPVLFSGLAPGFVGLYVVTLQVPAGAPVGNAVPVVLSIGGIQSNTVTIAVE